MPAGNSSRSSNVQLFHVTRELDIQDALKLPAARAALAALTASRRAVRAPARHVVSRLLLTAELASASCRHLLNVNSIVRALRSSFPPELVNVRLAYMEVRRVAVRGLPVAAELALCPWRGPHEQALTVHASVGLP